MKVVILNSFCDHGSTGKICRDLSESLLANGVDNYVLYSRRFSKYTRARRYSLMSSALFTAIKSRILGNYGINSLIDTYRLIRFLNYYKPDAINIHNIHSHDCNFELLFSYLRKHHIKVFYTFHDCWAFTGYCMYFDAIGCDKWKTECNDCPLMRNYSWFFDRSRTLFRKKKKNMSNLDMTIITPSKWLANLVRHSFLSQYPIKVVNNGIDLNVFKPTESCFREQNNLLDSFIILGVASVWEKRKGLDAFVYLANKLNERCKIVLVGTNDLIDKQLPSDIISIHRTANQTELAALYSTADVFVNPTMEDNFPTVNIESIACGTPVITYDTGGSAEMLDEKTGIIVPRGDKEMLLKAVLDYCENSYLLSIDCVEKAKKFEKGLRFDDYINLFIGKL